VQRVTESLAILGPGSVFERFGVVFIEFLLDVVLVQRGSSIGASPVGGALDATTADGKLVVETSILKSYFDGSMGKPRGDLAHALELAPLAEDIYLLGSQRAPTGVIEAFTAELGESLQMKGCRVHLMDGRAIAEAIVDRLMLRDEAIDALAEILPMLGDVRDDHPASLRAPPLTPLYVKRRPVDAEIDRLLANGTVVEICGIGGIGKSQAATACIRRNRGRFEYSFWVNARDLEGVEQLSSVQLRRGGAARNVSALLRKNRTLLVLDDAPEGLLAEQLASICGSASKIVVTRRKVTPGAYEVPMMDKRQARQVLGKNLTSALSEEVFKTIWKSVGGHPLSLRLINSAVQAGITFEEIAEDCANIPKLVDDEIALTDRILGRLRPLLENELSVFLWAGQPYCDRAFLRSVIGPISLSILERYGLTAPESQASVRIHDIVFSALKVANWLSAERAAVIDDHLARFILQYVRDDGHVLQTIANQLNGKIATNVENGDRRPALLYALATIWTGSAVRVDLLPEPLTAAKAIAGRNAREHEVDILVVLETIEARGRHVRQMQGNAAAVEWASSILLAYDELGTMENLTPRQVAEIGHHRAKTLRFVGRHDEAERMFEEVLANFQLNDAKLQLLRLLNKRTKDHGRAKQYAEEIIAAKLDDREVSSSLLMALGDTLNGARATWAGELVDLHEELFLAEGLYSASVGVSQGYHSIASFVRALVWHAPERVAGIIARLPEPTPLMLDDDQSRGGYAEIMFHAATVANDRSFLARALDAYETLKSPDPYQQRKWGETLYRLDRFTEAEERLESFDDEDGRIWLAHSLSQVKLALGKVEEALLLVDEAVDGAVGIQRRYRSSFLLQRVKVKIALGQDPSEDIEQGIAATQNIGLLTQFTMLQQ
jgi:tetratricopeptide (TPR) repeat protein